MKNRLPKIFWASLIATIVLLTSCTNQVENEWPWGDSSSLPSPEIVSGDSEELQKKQVFPELGISLVIPDELFVITNADYNSEDPTLIDSYQLYIQN